MVETNTLSILKNIKKKMERFDQEPKKIETIAGVNDEFEYISSSKPKDVEVKATVDDLNYNRDAGFNSEIKQDSTPAAQDSKAASPNPSDDFGLDDLSDLEDEVFKTSAAPTSQAQPASPVKTSVEEKPVQQTKAEEDIFDLNLELEDEPKKENTAASLPAMEESVTTEEKSDEDFDLSLDLEDDENEQSVVETEVVAEPAQQSVSSDLSPQATSPQNKTTIDDLDLDELLKEEESKKAQNSTPAPLKEEKAGSTSDDEFLKELGIDIDEKQTPAANKDKEKLPEIDELQDIKPVQPVQKAEQNGRQKVEQKSNVNALLDDIDLEDLNNIEQKMFTDGEAVKAVAPNQKQDEVLVDHDQGSKKTSYISADSNLESMLESRHFSDIAMHLLEPKLDAWLDQHLHSVVEKIVQEEVKKLFDKK